MSSIEVGKEYYWCKYDEPKVKTIKKLGEDDYLIRGGSVVVEVVANNYDLFEEKNEAFYLQRLANRINNRELRGEDIIALIVKTIKEMSK